MDEISTVNFQWFWVTRKKNSLLGENYILMNSLMQHKGSNPNSIFFDQQQIS